MKNIAQDRTAQMELVTKWKSMGTPTIVVDDKHVIVGFQKGKLSEALGLAS